MKRFLITLIIIAIALLVKGQSYSNNFTFRDKLYSIKSEKQNTGSFITTIEGANDSKSNFVLKPLKLENFEVAFRNGIISTLDEGNQTLNPSEKTNLTDIAKSQFFSIVAENLKEPVSDAPLAGKLKIAKEITVWSWIHKKEDAIVCKTPVLDIEIEFYEGYIETIKVEGTITENGVSRRARFENIFGIGFSTRNNYKTLSRFFLFDSKSTGNYYIRLSELLDYEYTVKPMTKDFSPANQVITTHGDQKVELHKAKTSKLFEAIVFSDFLGIDKEKPNGLIQTEIAKRINLSTSRLQTPRLLSLLSKGHGFFQYIRPAFILSKIEEHNRFFIPTTKDSITKTQLENDSLIQTVVASPLELLRHQNTSLGIDLNVLFFENPDLKYHLYLNGGFRFGRTAVRDSLRTLNTEKNIEKSGLTNEFGVNHFTIYPEVILQFLPEERFSLTISNKLQYFSPAFNSPTIETVDKNLKIEENLSNWINSLEVLMSVKTGQNGKLFGRWRFNNQLGNTHQNFHQLQVGYSFYLLKSNE